MVGLVCSMLSRTVGEVAVYKSFCVYDGPALAYLHSGSMGQGLKCSQHQTQRRGGCGGGQQVRDWVGSRGEKKKKKGH